MAKILYAEDDRDLSAMVIQWLKLEQHEVDDVESGTEALEHLEMISYDIIILDWNLPDLDGLNVCEIFRSKNGSTPIVLLTGMRGKEVKETGIKAGANKIFLKPPDLPALCAYINELC
jgi:DNA-binding response OmpR family regulator